LPAAEKAKELFQRAHLVTKAERPHDSAALARLILARFHFMPGPDARMFVFMALCHVRMFKRLLVMDVLAFLMMPLAHLVALAFVAGVNFVNMLAGHSAITLLTRMARMGRATIKGRHAAACRASSFAPRTLMRHRGIAAAALPLMGFAHVSLGAFVIIQVAGSF
jgi:hypothetical protein